MPGARPSKCLDVCRNQGVVGSQAGASYRRVPGNIRPLAPPTGETQTAVARGRCYWRTPLRLDRRTLVEDVVAEHVRSGEGLFMSALHRQFAKAGLDVRFTEHSAP